MTEREWRNIFADRLSTMMRCNNASRRGVVRASGISEGALSYYLSGQKTPSFKAIINLAYTLGCTIEDLIDFGEEIL
jgi:transcriptional regulator with XRE-family HTH domain